MIVADLRAVPLRAVPVWMYRFRTVDRDAHAEPPSFRGHHRFGSFWRFSMKIYVGNLSYASTEDGLREEFQKHGAVDEVTIVVDRFTGRSRGFAFVTMPNSEEANAAIAAINGMEIDGRTLSVNEARSKKPEGGGGFRRRREE
jgi:hypothetical protein